jgi:plastocyanin
VRLAPVAPAALLLAALLLATLLLATPAAGASAPARVQVSAKEFYFVLSRRTVTAGPAIVELVNFGEDPHDLRIERVGGTHVYRTPVVQPGPASYYDLSLTLLPGKYKLWCGIADHRRLGMQAVLTVVAKKKPTD